MDFIILVLLVGIAALVFVMWRRTRSEKASATPQDLPLAIENVRAGGMIKLTRVGEEMADFDVSIVGRHVYRAGGYEWYELEGEGPEGKVWLDVEQDDEVEVAISLRQLDLADVGLDRAALTRMDDEEAGEIQYEGRTYHYEESGEAQFLRNGEPGKAETLKYWDFESDDGRHYLGVEAWEGREFQVHYGRPLAASQIEIFTLSGDERHV